MKSRKLLEETLSTDLKIDLFKNVYFWALLLLACLTFVAGLYEGPEIIHMYLLPASVFLFGAIAYFVTRLKNKGRAKNMVLYQLHKRYDPNQIHSEKLRKMLEQAFEYRVSLALSIYSSRELSNRSQFLQSARAFDEQLDDVYKLIQRVDFFYKNRGGLEWLAMNAGFEEKKLRDQLIKIADQGKRRAILDAIKGHEDNQAMVEKLKEMVEAAETRLSSVIAHFGGLLANLAMVSIQSSAGRVTGVIEESQEEIRRVQDLLSAMEEVQTSSFR